jgi:predicted small integral membrane protein
MIEARILKIVMIGSLAVFALLVTWNNLVDYDSNYQFVGHVLRMDTTFPGNELLNRQVTSPALWRAACAAIILGEGLTGLFLAGAAIAFLVWFFGFMVIGGEWFQMWQSQSWNGQQAAFRIYMTVLAVLIFVNQADGELAPS